MTGPVHALVVGGTGMLAETCLGLAARGYTVSVVARRHAGLSALAAEARRRNLPGAISALPADYHDRHELAARLRAAQAAHGPVRLAVCWIHSSAPGAPMLVAEVVGRPACHFFHIVGSAAARPPGPGAAAESIASIEGIRFRRIVLGFAVEGGVSRWLTDAEISSGVLEAIESDQPEFIVGTVRPWSARPARP